MNDEPSRVGWMHVNRRGSGKRSYWEPIAIEPTETIEQATVKALEALEALAKSLAEENSLLHFPTDKASR